LAEYGEIPEHLLPPVLSFENQYSIMLYQQIHDQVKISPTGQVFALDLASIASYFQTIEVDDLSWQVKKMKIIFSEQKNTE